ncbi:ATP synthase F0 subunit B [Ochrobactrum sp. GPK 3]|uniref:ATP synthase F0 subunit B n=1 Tax=Brucella sp. 22210 TaxID=3453892 RepID=UPI0031384DF7
MSGQQLVSETADRGYVDWPAILAGVTISSGVMIVLTAFAGGLGLGSISLDDGEFSLVWLIVTALFVVISAVASNMLGGYISGRLRRPVEASTKDERTIRDGLNGLVVWGIGVLISGILAFGAVSNGAKVVGSAAQTAVEATGSAVGGAAQGAGQLVGGIVSGAGSAVGGAAQGAGQAASPSLEKMLPNGIANNPIDYFVDTLTRSESRPNGDNSADFKRQVTTILSNLVRTGEISDADRTWIVNRLAAQTGIEQSEVQTRVDQTIEQVKNIRADAEQKLAEAQKAIDDAKAEAERIAEVAKNKAAELAENTRVAGILTAFLLAASALVAAVAAYIGAVHGGRHRDEGRVWGGLAYRR